MRGRRRDVRGVVFQLLLLLSLGVALAALGALLIDVLLDGRNHLTSELFTQPPSSDPELAGARPAILATIYIGLLLLAFTVPIGIGTAIYLAEDPNK